MDALLRELVPYKGRLWIYLIAMFVALGVSAWQAADGNWFNFALSLATALIHGQAASNVNVAEEV